MYSGLPRITILTVGGYHNLMMDNINEITDKKLVPLEEIKTDKIMVAKVYNKKI